MTLSAQSIDQPIDQPNTAIDQPPCLAQLREWFLSGRCPFVEGRFLSTAFSIIETTVPGGHQAMIIAQLRNTLAKVYEALDAESDQTPQ